MADTAYMQLCSVQRKLCDEAWEEFTRAYAYTIAADDDGVGLKLMQGYLGKSVGTPL